MHSTMCTYLSQLMHPLIKKYQAWLLLCGSLAWSVAAYTTGYEQGTAQQTCDPFQLINDTATHAYPSIEDLLKKAK